MPRDINRPALYLTGYKLNNDWEVKERLATIDNIENESFAITYKVEKEGKTAVLKALDFSIALIDEEPIAAIKNLTEKYNFEKELLELCLDNKLENVVKILDNGLIRPLAGGVIPVPYFILEYSAEDVKSQIKIDSYLNLAWLLKILHNVTKGLFQLHRLNVSHKNLKPEHVKAFSADLYKLSELGNAERRGANTPHPEYFSNADPAYMTPESLYGYVENDWIFRGQATDLYHLGSLIFFLFTQTTTNVWLRFYLDETHNWNNWGGTYDEVLPYLLEAFDKTVEHFRAYVEDKEIQSKLEIILRSLCHPNPKERGHSRNPSAGKFGPLALEKYLSDFDLFRKKALLNLAKLGK